jgi:putative membrane protein
MSDRSDTLDKAKERTTLADEKTDPADERTVLARQRTLLAVERTVSAWIRTGIAAMAAGVGIARLLGAVQPAWITRAIGALLVLVGAGAYSVGLWRYVQAREEMESRGLEMTPKEVMVGLIVALVLSAALAFALLFIP